MIFSYPPEVLSRPSQGKFWQRERYRAPHPTGFYTGSLVNYYEHEWMSSIHRLKLRLDKVFGRIVTTSTNTTQIKANTNTMDQILESEEMFICKSQCLRNMEPFSSSLPECSTSELSDDDISYGSDEESENSYDEEYNWKQTSNFTHIIGGPTFSDEEISYGSDEESLGYDLRLIEALNSRPDNSSTTSDSEMIEDYGNCDGEIYTSSFAKGQEELIVEESDLYGGNNEEKEDYSSINFDEYDSSYYGYSEYYYYEENLVFTMHQVNSPLMTNIEEDLTLFTISEEPELEHAENMTNENASQTKPAVERIAIQYSVSSYSEDTKIEEDADEYITDIECLISNLEVSLKESDYSPKSVTQCKSSGTSQLTSKSIDLESSSSQGMNTNYQEHEKLQIGLSLLTLEESLKVR